MHREGEGAAGRLRHKPSLPQAQAVRVGCDRLIVKLDGDLLRRRGLAPQMDRCVALQHRMVGNQAGKSYFRPSGCNYQADHTEGKDGEAEVPEFHRV